MPTWVPWVAKGLALVAMLAVLSAVVTATGMLTQLANGWTQLEPGLYLQTLFGFELVDYLLLTVLALTVHGRREPQVRRSLPGGPLLPGTRLPEQPGPGAQPLRVRLRRAV